MPRDLNSAFQNLLMKTTFKMPLLPFLVSGSGRPKSMVMTSHLDSGGLLVVIVHIWFVISRFGLLACVTTLHIVFNSFLHNSPVVQWNYSVLSFSFAEMSSARCRVVVVQQIDSDWHVEYG